MALDQPSLAHPFSLNGKTALVAGASRGIGLAIARGLADAGAHVILASRSTETLELEAQRICEQGGSAEFAYVDIADWGSIEQLAGKCRDTDILVNVSGINQRQHFYSYTREEYDRLMSTNLHGFVRLTQLIGLFMLQRGKGGRVISVGSLLTGYGLPYVSIYAMTKSALGGFTRALAAEWGKEGITVNCIAPGFVETDINREMWKEPKLREWLPTSQAIPRMGTPEEVASLAVYLASDSAAYITGQTIFVDGGQNNTGIWPFEP